MNKVLTPHVRQLEFPPRNRKPKNTSTTRKTQTKLKINYRQTTFNESYRISPKLQDSWFKIVSICWVVVLIMIYHPLTLYTLYIIGERSKIGELICGSRWEWRVNWLTYSHVYSYSLILNNIVIVSWAYLLSLSQSTQIHHQEIISL